MGRSPDVRDYNTLRATLPQALGGTKRDRLVAGVSAATIDNAPNSATVAIQKKAEGASPSADPRKRSLDLTKRREQ
jgi:hypothetical protein